MLQCPRHDKYAPILMLCSDSCGGSSSAHYARQTPAGTEHVKEFTLFRLYCLVGYTLTSCLTTYFNPVHMACCWQGMYTLWAPTSFTTHSMSLCMDIFLGACITWEWHSDFWALGRGFLLFWNVFTYKVLRNFQSTGQSVNLRALK